MLGQSTRRLYSAAELFVLQTLAGELSWVGRAVNGKNHQREQFTDVSHEIKNTLQLLVSNMAFLRESLSEPLSSEQEKFFRAMDSSLERLTGQLNRVPDVIASEAASEFLLSAPLQSDRES
jgi:signal transduction histidine kinase